MRPGLVEFRGGRLDGVFGISATLERLRAEHLYRSAPMRDARQGPVVQVAGRSVINFCSNDYLALASDPELVEAFKSGAERYGVGSAASQLICGRSTAHLELEQTLCEFLQRDRALLFSSGYLANLAVVGTLAGRDDLIAQDRLNHASLFDGAVLSRGRLVRYAHCDSQALAQVLRRNARRKLVFTDAVFSMDGDLAPLRELAPLAADADALFVVDDAHGIGVLGETGGGLLEALRLGQCEVPILIGTFGKAFGTGGAFVAGPEPLMEYLFQRARPFIYSTAPAPALAAATTAALHRVRSEPQRRARLHALIQRFRSGAAARALPVSASHTPIQPLIVGASNAAVALSQALLQNGFLVTPIRPPTVRAGTARLRITITAGHTEAQVDSLLDALHEALPA